jgi:hypothetical protein
MRLARIGWGPVVDLERVEAIVTRSIVSGLGNARCEEWYLEVVMQSGALITIDRYGHTDDAQEQVEEARDQIAAHIELVLEHGSTICDYDSHPEQGVVVAADLGKPFPVE